MCPILVKVLNLRKILQANGNRRRVDQRPFLISIGERAEELADAYENRLLTTQQALIEFEGLSGQVYEQASREQRPNGLR